MKLRLSGTAMAISLSTVLATSTNAAPLAPSRPAVAPESSGVQNVHWRGYRHCHWRDGERWCHGGGYDRDYDRGGIVLRFGSRHRHHDRDGDHGRRHERNEHHRR